MQKRSGRKPYSVREAYWIYMRGMCSTKYIRREKNNGNLNSKFIERIMLAVTEVNGCEICSYAHTRMALEQGMNAKEIKCMLQGEFENVPSEEIEAIMFAQHYADTRGNPSKASWEQIVTRYGQTMAYGILGVIRMIMIGNVYGIPLGSFKDRFRMKKDKDSSLFYELSMLLTILPFTPIVLLHALFYQLLRRPILKF